MPSLIAHCLALFFALALCFQGGEALPPITTQCRINGNCGAPPRNPVSSSSASSTSRPLVRRPFAPVVPRLTPAFGDREQNINLNRRPHPQRLNALPERELPAETQTADADKVRDEMQAEKDIIRDRMNLIDQLVGPRDNRLLMHSDRIAIRDAQESKPEKKNSVKKVAEYVEEKPIEAEKEVEEIPPAPIAIAEPESKEEACLNENTEPEQPCRHRETMKNLDLLLGRQDTRFLLYTDRLAIEQIERERKERGEVSADDTEAGPVYTLEYPNGMHVPTAITSKPLRVGLLKFMYYQTTSVQEYFQGAIQYRNNITSSTELSEEEKFEQLKEMFSNMNIFQTLRPLERGCHETWTRMANEIKTTVENSTYFTTAQKPYLKKVQDQIKSSVGKTIRDEVYWIESKQRLFLFAPAPLRATLLRTIEKSYQKIDDRLEQVRNALIFLECVMTHNAKKSSKIDECNEWDPKF